MDTQTWHERFLQQSRWTGAVREYFAEKVSISGLVRLLDVGCGTGAVQTDWPAGSEIHGIDQSLEFVTFFSENSTKSTLLTAGDAFNLPYPADSFDMVTGHFFLLWISNPIDVILEIKRVCRPGGNVLFFAEPDYGGRIDYPDELAEIGRVQAASLEQQGANPFIGRQIAGFAVSAGLKILETGIIGYQTGHQQSKDFWKNEWEMIRIDLKGLIPESELDRLENIDQLARLEGSRILFVPTFYLFSEVP